MSTIKQWLLLLLHFLHKIFVLFLITVGVVTLVCWYQQWWTLLTYGTVLTWAGVLLIGVAGAVTMGSYNARTAALDPHYHMARRGSSLSLAEQMQQDMQDSQSSFGVTLLFGLTGALVSVVGHGLTVWPWFG